jgi:uncharacterized membrane protein
MFAISCQRNNDIIRIKNTSGDIIVRADALAEQVPVFYAIDIKRTEIEFFVVKIDGKIYSFLNRCRKCFSSGRGFVFDNGYVRCMTCNVGFPAAAITKGVGSCYPIPVQGKSNEGAYMIEPEILYSAHYNKF